MKTYLKADTVRRALCSKNLFSGKTKKQMPTGRPSSDPLTRGPRQGSGHRWVPRSPPSHPDPGKKNSLFHSSTLERADTAKTFPSIKINTHILRVSRVSGSVPRAGKQDAIRGDRCLPRLPHQPSSQSNQLPKHSLEPADQFSAEKEHRGWDRS